MEADAKEFNATRGILALEGRVLATEMDERGVPHIRLDLDPKEVYVDENRSVHCSAKWASAALGHEKLTSEMEDELFYLKRILRSAVLDDGKLLDFMLRSQALSILAQRADMVKGLIMVLGETGTRKSTLVAPAIGLFAHAVHTEGVNPAAVTSETLSAAANAHAFQAQLSKAHLPGIAVVADYSAGAFSEQKLKDLTTGEDISVRVCSGKEKREANVAPPLVIATLNPKQLPHRPEDDDAVAKIAIVGPDHLSRPATGKAMFKEFGQSILR
jgi:hypothetical protein